MPRKEIVCQFSVQDIASVCGCSKSAIFHHIRKGHLDIEDLISVTKFIASMGMDDIRAEIGMAFGRIGQCGPPVKQDSQKGIIQKKISQESKKSKKPAHKITRIQG